MFDPSVDAGIDRDACWLPPQRLVSGASIADCRGPLLLEKFALRLLVEEGMRQANTASSISFPALLPPSFRLETQLADREMLRGVLEMKVFPGLLS